MRITSKIFGLVLAISSVASYADGKVQWGYEGKVGPENWGDLNPDFAMCKTGQLQAPINIPSSQTSKTNAPIKLEYKISDAVIVNNGHTIQVNVPDGGDARFGETNFKIAQFHMHTPSEEKIDGKGYPLNAHFVHLNPRADASDNKAGKIAVIGLFFNVGAENAALKPIFDNMPAKEGETPLPGKLDLTKILPTNLSYYNYAGSLTTPGCSEDGVSFYILKTPVELSSAQLAQFQKIFPMNARPVMPLNGRKITDSH